MRARRTDANAQYKPKGKKARPFWSLVNKTEKCWFWTGYKNRDGYGALSVGGKSIMAHRFAWVEYGRELPAGCVLMHVCDTPACVRPDHLRVGTSRDNQRDKVLKGRQAVGERVHNAILTEHAVRTIRAEYRPQSRPGIPDGNARELAARFNVTDDVIWKVIHGRSWSHVK